MNVYGIDLSLLAQKLQQDLAKINVKLVLKPATFNVWAGDIDKPGASPRLSAFSRPIISAARNMLSTSECSPATCPWGKRWGGDNPRSGRRRGARNVQQGAGHRASRPGRSL